PTGGPLCGERGEEIAARAEPYATALSFQGRDEIAASPEARAQITSAAEAPASGARFRLRLGRDRRRDGARLLGWSRLVRRGLCFGGLCRCGLGGGRPGRDGFCAGGLGGRGFSGGGWRRRRAGARRRGVGGR